MPIVPMETMSGGTKGADTSSSASASEVQQSAQLINRCLFNDRESIDLAHKLSINSTYSGVCSGTDDKDYPSTPCLPLVTDVKRVPLPPELIEQFDHMQCNCLIGLFPEIGRAWLTVDSDIFVWRYDQGDDLSYFDGLKETILSVALVQPKPGIFRQHVKYLLVLTTPLDIVILGVSFSGDDINRDMHLLSEPLFTLPTDSTYLMQTIATPNGRIFSGGRDGCLYEVEYQAGGSWFRGDCQKVNHSQSRFSFLIPSMMSQLWRSENDAISQITVDETRNILYTRSETGSIGVFDLGSDGKSTSRVTLVNLDSIIRKARSISVGIEPSNLTEIVHIAPITLQESRYLNLVAITQAGIRLYFVVTSSMYGGSALTAQNGDVRPNGLYLVHIRLPPGFTNSSVQRPTSIHAAYYKAGSLLLASTNGDDATLWYVNGDMFAFDKVLKENHRNFPLDGRSWAISQLSSAPVSQLAVARLPANTSSLGIPPDPPIHVLQHLQQPSEYIVVTSQGCHIFYKLRPVDQLRTLLEKTADPSSELIEEFFRLYDKGEGVCCCIILAISPKETTNRAICDRATAVFLQHGGIRAERVGSTSSHHRAGGEGEYPAAHHHITPLSPIQNVSMAPSGGMPKRFGSGGAPVAFSTPMPGSLQHQQQVQHQQQMNKNNPFQQQQPQQQANTTTATSLRINGENGFYSERQQGLYKVFSRFVRPIWEGNIIEENFVVEDGRKRSFAVSRPNIEVVTTILEDLKNLKTFMTKYCLVPANIKDINQLLYRGLQRHSTSHMQMSQSPVNLHQMEQQKKLCAETCATELTFINQLYQLNDVTIQVLGLWRLILHHQLHVIIDNLDQNTQSTLRTMVFHELVTNGKQICCALVNGLVSQFMNDHSTIGALSCQLREICPDFYSPDDLTCAQATELLNQVRTSLPGRRKEQLEESLQLLMSIAKSVNLPSICQQLQSVQYFEGVVELCMKAANLRDAENLALKFHYTFYGCIDETLDIDPAFKSAHFARLECYKCITDMLSDLLVAAESHPQAPSVPTKPGPPQLNSSTKNSTNVQPLTPKNAQIHAETSLQIALKSSDELLHITLYDWMLHKNMIEQITRVESPFIEKFLILQSEVNGGGAMTPSGGNRINDLLWQWYERNGRHLQAAQVLIKLAEKVGSERDLIERIELLSRAKVHAKSLTSMTSVATNNGQLLGELEDKIQVSKIQLETLKQLQEYPELRQCVTSLNSQLYDITTIYQEYADQYDLGEIKLQIFQAAGEHNEILIKDLWQNIIEKLIANNIDSNVDSMTSPDVPNIIKHKMISLSQNYANSERYFPLKFLVEFLEKVSLGSKWNKMWVLETFLSIGVTTYDLLGIYSQIHAKKDGCWSALGNPHHVIDVINNLLTVYLDGDRSDMDASMTMQQDSNRYKRHMISRSLDLIAMSLVELTSQSIRDVSTNLLISSLQKNQAKFESLRAQV